MPAPGKARNRMIQRVPDAGLRNPADVLGVVQQQVEFVEHAAGSSAEVNPQPCTGQRLRQRRRLNAFRTRGHQMAHGRAGRFRRRRRQQGYAARDPAERGFHRRGDKDHPAWGAFVHG